MTELRLDGWSMGIHQTKMAADSIPTVRIVQHQENGGDVMVFSTISSFLYNVQFTGTYSVIAGSAPPSYETETITELFGLQKYGFTKAASFGAAGADDTVKAIQIFYKY